VTAFAELERGDIVWGTDPLSDKGRPMLVLGTPQFPNHGLQLITVLISTKAYHEESFTLRGRSTRETKSRPSMVTRNPQQCCSSRIPYDLTRRRTHRGRGESIDQLHLLLRGRFICDCAQKPHSFTAVRMLVVLVLMGSEDAGGRCSVPTWAI